MIRNIRLLGAALGGLVGLALAASARLFEQSAGGGWLLAAWVVAWEAQSGSDGRLTDRRALAVALATAGSA